ncbi:hypothetical protein GCM10020331_016600 [Ectobacillus funiculus]
MISRFFRFSSKLIPLANHEELPGWDYILPLKDKLLALASYIKEHNMRVDFHPDHFVVLNSPGEDIFKAILKDIAYALPAFKRNAC